MERFAMSKSGVRTLLLVCVSLGAPAVALAEPPPPAGLKGDILLWVRDARDKLLQLAEATPEAKYAWRPAKGVRSIGDVYMHAAAANFGVPDLVGVKPPAGFKFETYEKSLTKRADIVAALKTSFAHMEQGLVGTPDAQLDKPADFFGTKTTVRGVFLRLLAHAHEHLGQSVAYARQNGIVPPWSAKSGKGE